VRSTDPTGDADARVVKCAEPSIQRIPTGCATWWNERSPVFLRERGGAVVAGLWGRGDSAGLAAAHRQPVRLAVAACGISFAGILMFMQAALPRTAVRLPASRSTRSFDADLWLISPRTIQLGQQSAFRGRRLVQSLADSEWQDHAGERNLMIWRKPRKTQHPPRFWAIGFEPTIHAVSRPGAEDSGPRRSPAGPGSFDEQFKGGIRSGVRVFREGPHR